MSARAPGRTACRAEALRCVRAWGTSFFDAGSCIDGRLTSAWNWRAPGLESGFGPGMLCTRVPAVCGAAAERARAVRRGSKIEKKAYYPIFKVAGFTSFDGQW